jgi:phosphopantetheine adenylyltransferase
MCVLALLTAHVARAHEGHDHKILGTVTMAATDHVMLKDRDGKDVTVQVTSDTKVKSKPAMKVEEIKAGTRVVITATQGKDKKFTARLIEVGAAPAAGRK